MRLLHDLIEYSERQGLLTPFHVVSVDGCLRLGGALPRVEPYDKSIRIQVPIVKRTGQVIRPYDGYDNELYVLGMDDAHEKMLAFWTRQKEIARASGDAEALAAIERAAGDSSWLADARKAASSLLARKPKQMKHVMLALSIAEARFVDRPLVRAYFERALAEEANEAGPDFCLITGRSCNAVLLHASIPGVPGAGAGFPLVSFNQKTATQHELPQGKNFPVSLYAMRNYTSALTHLLATQSFRVGVSVCGVLWGPPEARPIATVIGSFFTEQPLAEAWAAVEKLATSGSDEKLHVLFLKGSQGREAILGYSAPLASVAAAALLRFRDCFRVVLHDGTSYEPTLLAKLRAVTPANLGSRKNKDAGQVLDSIAKVRAIESLLSGDGLPEDMLGRILASLTPLDVADSESEKVTRKARYAAANAQLQWFAFAYKKHEPKRHCMIDPIQKPTLEDFGLSPERPLPGAPDAQLHDFIVIGRLISLEESITYQAHKRHTGASSLPMIGVNLAVWYPDHFRRLHTAIEKLARGGRRGTYFTRQAEEAAAQISSVERLARTTPLGAIERAAILFGYTKQDAFARQLGRFLSAEAKKKRAAQVKDDKDAADKDAANIDSKTDHAAE